MRGPPSQSPGREVLERLYVQEGLSTAEIAGRLNVSQVSVWRWLRSAGIGNRDAVKEVDPALLLRLYVDEKKSTEQIAVILGWSAKGTVSRKLRLHGIPIRSKSEAASFRKHSSETRKKMSDSRKGKTSGAKGAVWSDERHARHQALWADPEFRAKVIPKRSGENSPLWRGGITPALDLRLSQAAWLKRRKECYIRDNGKCRDCGVKCLSRKESTEKGRPKDRIQAHHIISRRNGGGDELGNLVTLCLSCHHKLERRQAA